MKMSVKIYYLELTFFREYFLAVEIDEKGHTDRDIIFEGKSIIKKNLVVNLLELIQVMQKMVMI